MTILEKGIRIADHVVNIIIIMFFLPIFIYAIYTIWDMEHIYQQAESSLYETYKPDPKDNLSFEELKRINPDVFGWITVAGTHIDYPLVKADDNTTYINTDVKGEFSLSGSIFLDCRNEKNFKDINNIIYGHHMNQQAMFGEIELFENAKYFESHKCGELYYDGLWHEIEFFAFLHADAYDSVLYNTEVRGKTEKQKYLNYIKENAKNIRNFTFTKEEHFVTLSTCTSQSTNGRHLLIGRITGKTRSN